HSCAKSPVFRCCFHAGITGGSSAPFRMRGGHAGGTRVSPRGGQAAFRSAIHGRKAKTPPSGRRGVLRPAATPGEETRLRSAYGNSLTRAKFPPRVRVYFLAGGERKHSIEVVADGGVAFTGDLFERRAIEDVDETAAVADEARALQQARRDRHRG